MALIAVAKRRNGLGWTRDGRTFKSATSLEAVVKALGEPSTLLCEPWFYDDLDGVRRRMEAWLDERDHILAPVTDGARRVLESAGATGPKRHDLGGLISLAVNGAAAIDRRAMRDYDVWAVREALDVVHAVDLDASGSAMFDRAVSVVGPYESLDPATRDALGDGTEYRDDVLLACFRAATVATSRDEYERLLGLSAGGRGSLTLTIRTWYRDRNASPSVDRESALTWSDYRRALRFVFRRVRASRTAEIAA